MTAAPGASGGNAWAAPRDVRRALRDSVQQGDSVRRAVRRPLQAVFVRRFYASALKDGHEEPDSALKDALGSCEARRLGRSCDERPARACMMPSTKAATGARKHPDRRPRHPSLETVSTPEEPLRRPAPPDAGGEGTLRRHGEVELGEFRRCSATRAAVQRRPRARFPGGGGASSLRAGCVPTEDAAAQAHARRPRRV